MVFERRFLKKEFQVNTKWQTFKMKIRTFGKIKSFVFVRYNKVRTYRGWKRTSSKLKIDYIDYIGVQYGTNIAFIVNISNETTIFIKYWFYMEIFAIKQQYYRGIGFTLQLFAKKYQHCWSIGLALKILEIKWQNNSCLQRWRNI